MKTLPRFLALGATALVTAGVALATVATPAFATGASYSGTPAGSVTLSPATGTTTSAIDYTTDKPCPSGDSFYALLFGAGMPDAGEVITSKTSAGFSTTAPIKSGFQNTPKSYADKNNATLAGTYQVVVRCTQGLSNASLADFVGTMTFSGSSYTSSAGGSGGTPSPAASGTPNASGTPGGVPLSLSTSTPDIQPNQQAILQASGSPNTTLELMCYSRPNTAYSSARKAATSTGSVTFTLLPGTNTRCYVRYLDNPATVSPSVVINVHTTLSLSAVKASGVRSYVFQGRNLPRMSGQLITLYRLSGGSAIRTATTKTDTTGIWRIPRTFTGSGTFTFVVKTSQTLNNAAGASKPYTLTIH